MKKNIQALTDAELSSSIKQNSKLLHELSCVIEDLTCEKVRRFKDVNVPRYLVKCGTEDKLFVQNLLDWLGASTDKEKLGLLRIIIPNLKLNDEKINLMFEIVSELIVNKFPEVSKCQ